MSEFPASFEPSTLAFSIYEDIRAKHEASGKTVHSQRQPLRVLDNSLMVGAQKRVFKEKPLYFPNSFEAEVYNLVDSPKENVLDDKENKADESFDLTYATRFIKLEESVSASAKKILHDSFMVLDTSLNNKTVDESISETSDVSAYSHDIFLHLKELEKNTGLSSRCIKKQQFITSEMRSILVDWLVEVAIEFKLCTETFYLTISYMDRILSKHSILREEFQLLGVTCMFIAAKFEEVYPPAISDFAYITDHTFTKQEIVEMERVIISILDFNFGSPTAYQFLRRLFLVSEPTQTESFLARYICELSLLDAEPFLDFLPSQIAASSLVVARLILNCEPWSQKLGEFTGYWLSNLQNVIQCLCKKHRTILDFPHGSISRKYKSLKFHRVADIESLELAFGEL